MQQQKPSFWKRPEGITGAIFLTGLVAGGGYLLYQVLPSLNAIMQDTLSLSLLLAALGGVIYMVLDPSMRNLVGNAYQSAMRWITGLFIKMDPISVIKGYLDDLSKNLLELSEQIGELRGEMRSLQKIVTENEEDIRRNLTIADRARKEGNQKDLILSTRKAGRLQNSNKKYELLSKKMDHLYSVLTRMYENAEVLHEDTQDHITVKEMEYKAIRASHKAMSNAKEVISGNTDKRALFEQSMDVITEDLSVKVGEMERFMSLSKNFMESIDVQNAVFEDEGLKLLNDFGSELLADEGKLDISKPRPKPDHLDRSDDQDNEYDQFF